MSTGLQSDIRDLAFELGSDPDSDAAVKRLVEAAGEDRAVVEQVRDQVALKLHGRAGDWEATAALTLLNKAVVSLGWYDKYSWKSRLGNKLRKP